jgi:hypothetical protein
MKVEVTDQDREKAGQIVEATWADFMRDQNTPFYRPTAELWAAMACMALSGIAWGRWEAETRTKVAIEEEREACAQIADDRSSRVSSWDMKSIADNIAITIRARGEKP